MSTWAPFLTALSTLALIYGLLALGLNLHYGYTGLLNFGHVAFFAAGAFTSALVTLPPPGSPAYIAADARYQVGFGQPFLVGLLAAGAAGGLLALLIGATSVRLGSHYLAIATFALAEIFHTFLSNEEWLTRGQYGISTVPQPLKGSLIPVSRYPYAYLGLTVLIVAILFVLTHRLTESPFGRVLRGIRADEVAARSLGKDTPRIKLKAFVLGGVLAGVAGSLWTHSVGAVHVGQFVPIVTFQVWLAVLLGGAGNNLGVLVGAFILIAFRESTRFLSDIPGLAAFTASNPTFIPSLRFVVIGLLLILVIRFYPDGVFPERKRPSLPRKPNKQGDGVSHSPTNRGNDPDRPPASLEIQEVRKHFGGVQAVDGCSFDVAQGAITGLIGPNGAGKTTLFNLITGLIPPDAGDIRYRGRSIVGLPPDRIARAGVVRTFQIPRSFDHMTVWENLMFAAPGQSGEGIWQAIVRPARVQMEEEHHAQRAWKILTFLGLDPLADEYAGALSGGQRKLLELARVLMMEPAVILLDEPAAGVNPALMQTLTAHIIDLNQRGTTFLIIEHDVDLIFRICQTVVVMHHGTKLAEGDPETVRRDPRVLEAYLGG